MTETLTLTPHRTISSMTILAVALIIAASMALGFGIRSWTQSTTIGSRAAAAQTVAPATPATIASAPTGDPAPMLRLSGPR
jgi:hypothetical protein